MGVIFLISENELKMWLLSNFNEALRTLKSYIEHELRTAMEFTWTPTVYTRTGATAHSVYISQSPKFVNGEIVGEIGFLDYLANHGSRMGKGQPDGYTPLLLEVGWSINQGVQPRRAFFTDHPGYHYIQKAVERFNREYTDFQVSVYIKDNGNEYKYI